MRSKKFKYIKGWISVYTENFILFDIILSLERYYFSWLFYDLNGKDCDIWIVVTVFIICMESNVESTPISKVLSTFTLRVTWTCDIVSG